MIRLSFDKAHKLVIRYCCHTTLLLKIYKDQSEISHDENNFEITNDCLKGKTMEDAYQVDKLDLIG